MKIIYDFGMNNGDDVDYYLKKGFKVVGVEANPELCKLCTKRFDTAIAEDRLVILNVALSDRSSSEPITFYVHKSDHVRSQLPKPNAHELDSFRAIQVPQRKASDIITEYGAPHYIKSDIEWFDQVILRDLFSTGIYPDFISAEIHSIEIFALLVYAGYNSFNLVDGPSVHRVYRNANIASSQGRIKYSFRPHSAGPYGEDITTPWYNAEAFLYVLASEKLGWKDIHASKIIAPAHQNEVPLKSSFTDHLRDFLPSFSRAVKRRLRRDP